MPLPTKVKTYNYSANTVCTEATPEESAGGLSVISIKDAKGRDLENLFSEADIKEMEEQILDSLD